jgi:hypothetical protein
MRSKIIVVLIAVAAMDVSSAAMARGGGGGGGGGGKGGSGWHGHAQFGRTHFGNRFDRRFLKKQFLLGGWGWDWGLGWPYGEGGSSTNVVVFPQATPQMADVTGSATPCHWNSETFTVPASAGGSRPVQVVSCR